MTGRRSLFRVSVIPPGLWLILAFAIFLSMMLWASLDLSRASAWIPRIVLGFTLIVLLLEVSAELMGVRSVMTGTEPPANADRRMRALAAIAWITLLLLASWLLGVTLGSALFCAAWLRWHAGERWIVSLLIAVGAGLVLWLLFALLKRNIHRRAVAR